MAIERCKTEVEFTLDSQSVEEELGVRTLLSLKLGATLRGIGTDTEAGHKSLVTSSCSFWKDAGFCDGICLLDKLKELKPELDIKTANPCLHNQSEIEE